MASQVHRRFRKKRFAKSNQQSGHLPRNSAPIKVKINHVGGRGDGVVKLHFTRNHSEEEHDVFVLGGLPGKVLVVKPLSLTAQGIKAQIFELVLPSPDRNTPRCYSFPACGGCRFQRCSELAIRTWKKNLVITFLD